VADRLQSVLDECWVQESGASGGDRRCRWCEHPEADGHATDCPCLALAQALGQRDALAAYAKAEKRSMMMQSAVRLAKRVTREDVRKRMEQAVLELEAAHARLRKLGIEDLLR